MYNIVSLVGREFGIVENRHVDQVTTFLEGADAVRIDNCVVTNTPGAGRPINDDCGAVYHYGNASVYVPPRGIGVGEIPHLDAIRKITLVSSASLDSEVLKICSAVPDLIPEDQVDWPEVKRNKERVEDQGWV